MPVNAFVRNGAVLYLAKKQRIGQFVDVKTSLYLMVNVRSVLNNNGLALLR